MLFDCCHSGTIADLPYIMGVRDKKMKVDLMFDTDTLKEMEAMAKAAQQAKDAKKLAKKAAKKAEYDKKVERIKQYQAHHAAQPVPVVYQQAPGSTGLPASGTKVEKLPGGGTRTVTTMQMPMQVPAGATITIGPDGQPMINGKHMKLPPGAVVTGAVMQTGAPVQIPADIINGKTPIGGTKTTTRRVVRK